MTNAIWTQKLKGLWRVLTPPLSLPPVVGFAAQVYVNAISTLLSFFAFVIWQTSWGGNGPPGSHRKDLLGKPKLSNGSPFSHKRTLMENGGLPNWLLFFFEGDFCGNWRWSNWPLLSHEGPSWKMRWSEGPPFSQKGSSWKTQGAQKGLCFSQKDLSWKTKGPSVSIMH